MSKKRKKVERPFGRAAELLVEHPLPPGCEARYFEEGDEPGMLECVQCAFGSWPRIEISVAPLDHLHWKLRMQPEAVRSHIVAVLDGRFIAIRPLWAQYVKVDDHLFLARQAVDRAVVPEFQRSGIMTALEVRMPGTWATRFDMAFSVRVNWQRVNLTPGQNYVRPIDVVARSLDLPAPRIAAPWTLRVIETFDARFDALWSEASTDFRVAAVRDSARLNYRFADRRGGNYRIVVAEQDTRLLGYLISTSRREIATIADALVLPGRTDVLESLLADAIDDLRGAGKTSVEFWRFPYHPYVPALQKLGFDEPRRTEGVNFRSLKGRDGDFAFFTDQKQPAHFMAGDTDIV